MRRKPFSNWLTYTIVHFQNWSCTSTSTVRQCRCSTISYVSDVEGNIGYWERFLNISAVLKRNEITNKIILNDDCMFVYGGDVCDRGPGDIRFLKDLMQLKYDYPSRVHFIIGNRDVNKLRIPYELNIKKLLRRNPQVR